MILLIAVDFAFLIELGTARSQNVLSGDFDTPSLLLVNAQHFQIQPLARLTTISPTQNTLITVSTQSLFIYRRNATSSAHATINFKKIR
jgi:hypothetical protein